MPENETQSHRRNPSRLQLQLSERRLLLIWGDGAATFVAVLIAIYVWSVVAKEGFSTEFIWERAGWFIALPGLWFLLASANDFYNLRVTARIRFSLTRLVFIQAQLIFVYLIIFFLVSRDTPLPRLFIFYYAVVSFGLIGLWRLWRPFLIGWTGSRRRALILGTGPSADVIVKTIRAEAPGDYHIVGCVTSSDNPNPTCPDDLPLVGSGGDLATLVRTKNISELIIAYDSQLPADVFQGVMACYEFGIAIVPMPLLYEQITGRVPIEHVGQHWAVVLPLEGQSLTFNIYSILKRLMDITLALVGLVIFAIILIPLWILVQLDSPGPLFYAQERVGRGGRIFKVIKLRSMIPDAEKNTGPKWATANDPRVTRLGRLFRKTRLDEVPQLVNVLFGQMSFVGPRPERPHFVDELTLKIPFYRTRLVVPPGLTGWAQVKYKYGNTTEDALIKLQYDLYYIRHRSLLLDVLIMFRTVGKILTLGGT